MSTTYVKRILPKTWRDKIEKKQLKQKSSEMRSSVPPSLPCSFFFRVQTFEAADAHLNVTICSSLWSMRHIARITQLSLSPSPATFFFHFYRRRLLSFFRRSSLLYGARYLFTSQQQKNIRINKWKLSNWNLHRNFVDGWQRHIAWQVGQKQYLRIFSFCTWINFFGVWRQPKHSVKLKCKFRCEFIER